MITREKVILGITAAAAVGAGIYYALTWSTPSSASSQPVAQTDFSALIAKVQVDLKQAELTGREETIIAAASTQWLRNPLRARPLSSQAGDSSSAVPLPKYMGFINTGPKPIAIIDGRDYRPGEAIEGGEFQLAQVYPDHIELLRRGATDPVEVKLEKPQTPGISR